MCGSIIDFEMEPGFQERGGEETGAE